MWCFAILLTDLLITHHDSLHCWGNVTNYFILCLRFSNLQLWVDSVCRLTWKVLKNLETGNKKIKRGKGSLRLHWRETSERLLQLYYYHYLIWFLKIWIVRDPLLYLNVAYNKKHLDCSVRVEKCNINKKRSIYQFGIPGVGEWAGWSS